jgi:membrane fusion protein, multidrug efflux system
VPEVGVTHDQKGQATTLVVGPDNKVTVRPIQATATFGDKWVVEGGLKEGERVIVAGVQKVQPGMLVQAVESPESNASPATSPASIPRKDAPPTDPRAARPAATEIARSR